MCSVSSDTNSDRSHFLLAPISISLLSQLPHKLNRLVRHVYPPTNKSYRALLLSHHFTRISCSCPSFHALSCEPQRHPHHWSTSLLFQLIHNYLYLHTAGPFHFQRRSSTPLGLQPLSQYVTVCYERPQFKLNTGNLLCRSAKSYPTT